MLERFPRRALLLLAIVGLGMFFLLAFRTAFWLAFRDVGAAALAGDLAHAWYVGSKLDLRLCLALALPLCAICCVPRIDPWRPPWPHVWTAYLAATWLGVTFLYAVDFGHFAYLQTRLNATLAEHVREPAIAAGMVWRSYPVPWIVLGILVLVGAYVGGARASMRRVGASRSRTSRRASTAAWSLLALFFAGGFYGKLSWYPLRWSDAYASTHPFTAALGLNPVLFLIDTWDNRAQGYDLARVRERYDDVARYLRVDRPDREALAFERTVAEHPVEGRRPNVVVLVLESLAAFKTGMFGNPTDPTPHLDALADESLVFTRFFVPSGPTARSIFGLITSIPDVNAAHSASRNPLVVRQPTIFNAFTGYEKMYFIGGSASWGNIRGVLTHNIPDLRLYEEGDYSAPRNDVWGVSDLDLLRAAHAVFQKTERPFVAFVQTAGAHRPYTIPKDHGDFRPVTEADSERLFESGFDDTLVEYNGVRFLDYSVGEFFRLARQEPYYRDTVFFLLGDHGTSFPGPRPPLPGLESNHVPLIVHGPAFLPPPQRIGTVASSLDVLPTAAGLAGVGYVNKSLGRDLFAPDSGEPRRHAFVRRFPSYGLVNEEFFLELLPTGERRLYRYASDEPTRDVALERPEVAERMQRLVSGLYETAMYMLHAPDREE
jgi:phosphoglycerol transferase MdoB-like AlkP superfamily enzyme